MSVKRRISNIAIALSLLLLSATVVLWVRSYFVSDAITYGDARAKYGVQSASGWITVVKVSVPLPERATGSSPS